MKKKLLLISLPVLLYACSDDENTDLPIHNQPTVIPDSIIIKDMTTEESSFLKSQLSTIANDTLIRLDNSNDLQKFAGYCPEYIDMDSCTYIIGNVMLPESSCFITADSLSYNDGAYSYTVHYTAPSSAQNTCSYNICKKYGKLDTNSKISLNIERDNAIEIRKTSYDEAVLYPSDMLTNTLEVGQFVTVRTEEELHSVFTEAGMREYEFLQGLDLSTTSILVGRTMYSGIADVTAELVQTAAKSYSYTVNIEIGLMAVFVDIIYVSITDKISEDIEIEVKEKYVF